MALFNRGPTAAALLRLVATCRDSGDVDTSVAGTAGRVVVMDVVR